MNPFEMSHAALTAATVFVLLWIAEPLLLGLLRTIGVYTIVNERSCKVHILFGNVLGVLDRPGIHWLPLEYGAKAFLVNWLGKCHTLDLRLDQEYLRSQPVNSEEGAPMGIGVWFEMRISDAAAYLFNNTDPRGSLRANLSNATVRCLSNMPLAEMLETRHSMSQTVRAEVTEKSRSYGYELGSVYIRKVHFRDRAMIRQIEEKVVNRLRQVTSAIRQDGANQVNVITSSAEREAAVEYARAVVIRPRTVGESLKIAADAEVAETLLEILELEKLLNGPTRITLLPEGRALPDLLASRDQPRKASRAA